MPGRFSQFQKQTLTKLYDPNHINKLIETYRGSLGLNIQGELSCSNALETFEKNRISKAFDLKEPQVSGNSLGEILEKAEAETDPKYSLAALSDLLGEENNPYSWKEEDVEAGKIYLNDDGKYVVRDPKGKVQKGTLENYKDHTLKDNIDLKNLASKLHNAEFKKKILEVTSKAGHTLDHETKARQQISKTLDKALQKEEPFIKASNNFNKLIESINQRAKQSPFDLKPGPLTALLQDEKGKMVNAMKVQFQHENNALKDLTNQSEFKKSVIENLGVKESEFNTFINNIQANVKKEQDKQLKDFEAQMNKQITDLLSQRQAEGARIGFIVEQIRRYPKTRQFVEQKIGKHKLEQTLNADKPDTSAFLSIKLEDMAYADAFFSLSGKKISYNKKTGAFEYNFPRKWNIGYYYGRENNVQNDMRSLAEAVKACGHETIVMTINNKNTKDAEEMARMAYQAARKAGFPPDKITIEASSLNADSGKKETKEIDLEKIFKEKKHHAWKAIIEKDAEALDKYRKPRLHAEEVEKFKKRKNDARQLRDSLQQDSLQTAEPSSSTSASNIP